MSRELGILLEMVLNGQAGKPSCVGVRMLCHMQHVSGIDIEFRLHVTMAHFQCRPDYDAAWVAGRHPLKERRAQNGNASNIIFWGDVCRMFRTLRRLHNVSVRFDKHRCILNCQRSGLKSRLLEFRKVFLNKLDVTDSELLSNEDLHFSVDWADSVLIDV